ncbi:MAG: hypothetical protein L0H59_07715 [Tomitella sp.]|nr:hypothetical protein [Tomitella sp.]
MAAESRRSRSDMAKPKRRTAPNLGALAAVQDDVEPDVDSYTPTPDTEPDEPTAPAAPAATTPERPAPPRKERRRGADVVTKNLQMHIDTVRNLKQARMAWGMAKEKRMQKYGGLPSETAYAQALLNYGIDRTTKNAEEAEKLAKFFPPNARVAHEI